LPFHFSGFFFFLCCCPVLLLLLVLLVSHPDIIAETHVMEFSHFLKEIYGFGPYACLWFILNWFPCNVSKEGLRFPVFLPQMKSPWWRALGGPQCIQLATCISCWTPWPRNCRILPSAEISYALSCHWLNDCSFGGLGHTCHSAALCNADSRASCVCRERGAGKMVEFRAVAHCCPPGCQRFVTF
jgi:hypothetical protein